MSFSHISIACSLLLAGCATLPSNGSACATAHANYIVSRVAFMECAEDPGCLTSPADYERVHTNEAKVIVLCETNPSPVTAIRTPATPRKLTIEPMPHTLP